MFEPSNDKKPEFDWDSAWPKLMAFFSQIVAREDFWAREEIAERLDLVPTRDWMQTLIMSFLEAGTRDDKTAYPAALLPEGWNIIKTALMRH